MKVKDLLDKYGEYEIQPEFESNIKSMLGISIRVQNGDKCYIVDSTNSIVEISKFETRFLSHQFYYRLNRVYKTVAECKRYLEIHKALKEASFEPNWNDEQQPKFYLVYNWMNHLVDFDCSYQFQNSSPYYFKDSSTINDLIERFGNDDIAKYVLGIDDIAKYVIEIRD